MPTNRVKATVVDVAFGEAILTIAPFTASHSPTYQPLLTQATSILIQDHLLPQLNHLEHLTSLLPFTTASTIVYGALPPILESVRKTAHDLRGCHYEEHCYAHSIDSSDAIAMNEAWEMCEVVWEQACFAAVGLGIKFGDALREEAKATMSRAEQETKEEELSEGRQILGAATECARAAELNREVDEARKAFEAAMQIVGKQEAVEKIWGVAAVEDEDKKLAAKEDNNNYNAGDSIDEQANPTPLKPQPSNYDKVETHDWAVTANDAVSTTHKATSETRTHVPIASANQAAFAAIIASTPASVALATDNDKDNNKDAPQSTTTTTRSTRKRPGAATITKRRVRWEMEYRPAALARTGHGDAGVEL